MVRTRPRRARRAPLVVRVARFVVPALAVGGLASGVALAVSPGQTQVAYPAPAAVASVVATPSTDRHAPVSRSTPRPSLSATPSPSPTKASSSAKASAKATAKPSAKATAKPTPTAPPLKVTGTKYATAVLNVRVTPDQDSDVVTEVKVGTKLSITKSVRSGYRYIRFEGKGRWVKDQYLSDKKPTEIASLSAAACRFGTKVESGLTSDGAKVYRAACARFPQISSIGGRRSGGGNHGSGRAVDIMISDSTVGWEIAKWARANAGRLGVSEVIYSQKIWTVQRSGEGWRGMSDRGSATANHYDHVHVSVYGSRATG